jgi:hypothetical protein
MIDALTAASGCSGHGTCKEFDQCVCEPNWMGTDCSLRQCPYGAAFADSPLGDVNHDGDVHPSDLVSATSQLTNGTVNEMFQGISKSLQEAHFYSECSGKGYCDRGSGECQCFEGYTGHACQRTECPGHCSGHGVCRTLREIAAGSLTKRLLKNELGDRYHEGVQTNFDYNLWDADKAQACVCDSGYAGIDCSMRQCPRGDDPLTLSTRWHGNQAPEWAKIKFQLDVATAGESIWKIGYKGWDGRTNYAYAKLNIRADVPGRMSTADLPAATTTAGKFLVALRNMPGGQLNRVTVSVHQAGSSTTDCDPSTETECEFLVEFVGRPGKIDVSDFTVSFVSWTGTGTAPDVTTGQGPSIVSSTDGNREEITCSGRGLCDYSSGLCECFAGYYGASCENQNSLAAGSAAAGGTA